MWGHHSILSLLFPTDRAKLLAAKKPSLTAIPYVASAVKSDIAAINAEL